MSTRVGEPYQSRHCCQSYACPYDSTVDGCSIVGRRCRFVWWTNRSRVTHENNAVLFRHNGEWSDPFPTFLMSVLFSEGGFSVRVGCTYRCGDTYLVSGYIGICAKTPYSVYHMIVQIFLLLSTLFDRAQYKIVFIPYLF